MTEIEAVDGKIYFEGHLVARINNEAPPSIIAKFQDLMVEAGVIRDIAVEYDLVVGDIVQIILDRHEFD